MWRNRKRKGGMGLYELEAYTAKAPDELGASLLLQ